jgi:hypothetical protein
MAQTTGPKHQEKTLKKRYQTTVVPIRRKSKAEAKTTEQRSDLSENQVTEETNLLLHSSPPKLKQNPIPTKNTRAKPH